MSRRKLDSKTCESEMTEITRHYRVRYVNISAQTNYSWFIRQYRP